MPEDNNNSQDNNEPNLEEVVDIAPEDLSDEQKTFLQNTDPDDLTDDQKETFKDVLKKKEEEEEETDEEPRTRTVIKKKKEEEEEETDEDDLKMVRGIVQKELREAGVGDTRDQLQVDAVIRDNPEYSKYRNKALKYMQVHPSLVAEDAMRIVTATDQQKIGAQKEREAKEKADNTKGGGTPFRKTKGAGRDWSKATTEEMDAKKAEIFGRT